MTKKHVQMLRNAEWVLINHPKAKEHIQSSIGRERKKREKMHVNSKGEIIYATGVLIEQPKEQKHAQPAN